ncbi:hypothetical protein GH714_039721 [Hevea brasiliensis]|uniref:Myb/SANT-like DNA-binding domain-containing protein n=1 Tax=Hevea brasiliensis TaxID=3981 RepID=A0A6A6N0V0_HEVBR|nr:hypothetical protein GH714_039721 [Hevea brasiliensis]
MDTSGLGGRFLSHPTGGLLNLESPIHRQQQTQLGLPSLAHQNHMNLVGGHENDHQTIGLMEVKGSIPKGYSAVFSKGKAVSPFNATNNGSVSEDDEPSFTEDGNGENTSGAKGKKGSPWQRMKWTDNVVRLIAVVAYVGDDGAFEGVEGLKRKSGILQKKGKWKSVSKIMISKGCHVSPQQCEDKFNDLNKRYKRLNDILGRGTSCRVVEKPALMDSMPHLSAKSKDDVRKILSSKHLFYREMCAYHNGQRIPDCQDIDLQGCSLPLKGLCNGFEVEMSGILQDPMVSLWEKKEWIKKQKLQLLEQRVSIQAQAGELEKRRFKWLRYCSKKDREFDRLRLENERMRLENEQSILQLRQKQLEMDFRSSETSRDLTSLGIDRTQGRGQIDLDRHQ